jgi:hypothetical protein
MLRVYMFFLLLICALSVDAQNLVIVKIDQEHPGRKISDTFPGFSYETAALTDGSGYFNAKNKVLIQLIRNLGKGVLRIGGNTSDKINWAGSTRENYTGKDTLTTTNIDQFAAFAKATGWRVIFGLNMGSGHPKAAAEEAQYVQKKLAGSLYAFQLGNEPDLYYKSLRTAAYNYMDYKTEWDTAFKAIQQLTPVPPLAGPDVANKTDWVSMFAKDEAGKLMLIDGHYYHNTSKNPNVSPETLLLPDSNLKAYLQTLLQAAAKYQVPYRVSETNSVSRGGQTGVSDVFASALWGLDFMWMVAEEGAEGINFHGGSVSKYAPIVSNNGEPTPRPLYYGMLAFNYGSRGGLLLPVDIQSASNISAYACLTEDKETRITLINKEPQDKTLRIQIKKGTNAKISRLTAVGLSDRNSVEFAGSTVTRSGVFKPAEPEKSAIKNQILNINLPAYSAAIVITY